MRRGGEERGKKVPEETAEAGLCWPEGAEHLLSIIEGRGGYLWNNVWVEERR